MVNLLLHMVYYTSDIHNKILLRVVLREQKRYIETKDSLLIRELFQNLVHAPSWCSTVRCYGNSKLRNLRILSHCYITFYVQKERIISKAIALKEFYEMLFITY
jgi:hypothetical protein